MKNLVKISLSLVISLIVLFFNSCNDDDDCGNGCSKTGIIIGYNYTECLCCPGWIIALKTDTIKTLEIPLPIDPPFDSGWPLPVRLNYKDSDYPCDMYKEITCMELAD